MFISFLYSFGGLSRFYYSLFDINTLSMHIYFVLVFGGFITSGFRFPLYSRNKDKQMFKYAVFLLNKNIAHIRHHFNLPTRDLRLTLHNLRDFLLTKFGIG